MWKLTFSVKCFLQAVNLHRGHAILTSLATVPEWLTYLHRTQPLAPATEILNPLELRVLKAKSPKLPKVLTVNWAVEAVDRLGGYLEHWDW